MIKALTPRAKERFWRKVETGDGCWPWLGFCNWYGYGKFQLAGRSCGAHRIAYAIETGTDPGEMHVLHHCDNPPCVNPEHLFIGTNADNVRDKTKKGRAKGAVGIANTNAKLTDETVRDIRRRARQGEGSFTLARSFGVTPMTIWMVVTRKTWDHVDG